MMKNKDIEKNFKDKLESYESFEGDKMAMWDNIEKELDDKKNRKFIWFWLFPFFLGLMGSAWFVLVNNNLDEIEKEATIQQGIEKSELAKTELPNQNSEATFNQKNNEIITQLNPIKTQSSQTKTIKKSKKVKPDSVENQLIISSIVPFLESIIQPNQGLQNPPKTISIKNDPVLIKDKITVQFIPSLISSLLQKNDNHITMDSTLFSKKKKIDFIEKENHWSIRFGGGINSMNSGFDKTSTNGKTHSMTQSSQLGWNFMIEIERTFSNEMYLISGVHYNRNWLRFNYNSSEILPITFNDVIIRYDINLLPGDTTFVLGDTTINRLTTRDIQHHNQYDKIKIPILFGKKWEGDRFSYGGSAGIGLDFWLKQSGKYLGLDEVGIFNSTTAETKLPKLGWSAEFRGNVSFKLKQKVSLFAQPYLSVAMNNWSIIGDGAIQKPMVFGTNFGLQIKF